MTQDQIECAKDIFKRYPNAKVVYVSTDNQGFLAKDRAALHDKDSVEIKRSDVEKPKANNLSDKGKGKKSAEELIAEIPTYTIEQIEALEASGEKRATVLAAIAERREVIAKGINVNPDPQQ